MKETDAPVVPAYLGGLWGSILSYEGGKFFWKWPKRWRYPVLIRFGQPIYDPSDAEQVRRAVEALQPPPKPSDVPNYGSAEHPNPSDLILPRQFLRTCRRQMRQAKVADSMGVELTGGGLLLRTLILRRLLRREVLAPTSNL